MISVEHLTKSFGQRTVFQDLSLQFTEGKSMLLSEIVGVVNNLA